MKRRQAIQNILIGSAGLLWLPSCEFNNFPQLSNMLLEKEDFQLLQAFQEIILPQLYTKEYTDESPLGYTLTVIDQCYELADIEQFMNGFAIFKAKIGEHPEPFFERPESAHMAWFEALQEATDQDDYFYFLETTKALTIEHFTSSEYYQTQYLKYQFVPGPFGGCIPVGQ